MAAIEVEDLFKSYGSVDAVRGISFRVEEGEVFALLGPKGAGKTTTLEILEGHRRRNGGRVSVLGVDPQLGGRGLSERIGIVLQSAGLDAELTVREVLMLYAASYARSLPVTDVIALVGLEDKRRAPRRRPARRRHAAVPGYARQDRATRTESLGLAWVGALLRASGVDEVVCVDVHCADAGDLVGLPLTSLSPAGLLAAALTERWREEVTFVAPDEGAIARCSAVANAIGVDRPIVWARTRRTPTGVEHPGLACVPTSRAVVVNDILDTGGTLVSCCRQLGDAGVSQVGVMVTHGGTDLDHRHRALTASRPGTRRARRPAARTGARRKR